MKIWPAAMGLVLAGSFVLGAQNPPTAPAPPAQGPAQVPQPPAAAPPQTSTPSTPAQPTPVAIGTIILDPGHGGADAGARGASGILEKDVVMSLAQILRAALERQGQRVVLTRGGNDNPSYDDRAATANVYRGAVVIALHASSTGTVGMARAYFSPATPSLAGKQEAATHSAGLVRWDEAQQPYQTESKRLADAVQAQIRQRLEKSPKEAAQASLRDLRSIAAPAIAVELASVSVKQRKALDAYLGPLAEAIARGVQTYRGNTLPAGAN